MCLLTGCSLSGFLIGCDIVNDCYEYMTVIDRRDLALLDHELADGRLCDKLEPYTVDEILLEFTRELRYGGEGRVTRR